MIRIIWPCCSRLTVILVLDRCIAFQLSRTTYMIWVAYLFDWRVTWHWQYDVWKWVCIVLTIYINEWGLKVILYCKQVGGLKVNLCSIGDFHMCTRRLLIGADRRPARSTLTSGRREGRDAWLRGGARGRWPALANNWTFRLVFSIDGVSEPHCPDVREKRWKQCTMLTNRHQREE